MTAPSIFFLCLLIFLVAFCYSSVGHGGASGYLGVLSFFPFSQAELASTALLLNILVAGTSFTSYKKAGHFRWPLLYPFLLSSVPMAFLGGMIHLSTKNYSYLLAAVLLFAAFRLNITVQPKEKQTSSSNLWLALTAGAGIGLISGMIGIGGGIFLTPLLLFSNWATVKESAAVSAPFIVVNSAAGLAGRFLKGKLVMGMMFPFLFSAFLGGCFGSYLGANRFTNPILRRILGMVLLLAALKLFKTS